MKKIGILTGGGDCPGLNPVIRAVVRTAELEGWQIVGFKNGWKGIIDNISLPLNGETVSGILPRGGTILGTSRTNPYKGEGGVEAVRKTFEAHGLAALIAVGGEDTLGVASRLHKEGFNVVGVPKTIDNDLNNTDYTFGFDTAVNIAMECIDRLHTTAESHNRVIVVELMGRHAGWICLEAGLAGGADFILIPEYEVALDDICESIKKRHARGKTFSIVAVAEGAKLACKEVTKDAEKDDFGHIKLGGIGNILGAAIEKQTGYETRVTVLGHIQRGGSPTAFDRVLGTRFGVKAVELVKLEKYGHMVSLQGHQIVSVSLESAVNSLKTVPAEYYELAKVFFG